jgi:hypothetical protein
VLAKRADFAVTLYKGVFLGLESQELALSCKEELRCAGLWRASACSPEFGLANRPEGARVADGRDVNGL